MAAMAARMDCVAVQRHPPCVPFAAALRSSCLTSCYRWQCRLSPCTCPSQSSCSPYHQLPPPTLCLPLFAAVVSDAAAGGQVLLCGATFQSVGPMGKELGCVDENGLNFSKLGSWWRSW